MEGREKGWGGKFRAGTCLARENLTVATTTLRRVRGSAGVARAHRLWPWHSSAPGQLCPGRVWPWNPPLNRRVGRGASARGLGLEAPRLLPASSPLLPFPIPTTLHPVAAWRSDGSNGAGGDGDSGPALRSRGAARRGKPSLRNGASRWARRTRRAVALFHGPPKAAPGLPLRVRPTESSADCAAAAGGSEPSVSKRGVSKRGVSKRGVSKRGVSRC